MAAAVVKPPFDLFTDVDGKPLKNGYIFIGKAGLDAEVNPENVYWDKGLTVVADQPIRTLNGYMVNNGTAAKLFVGSDHSIIVRNKNGSLVFSSLSADILGLAADLSLSYEFPTVAAFKASPIEFPDGKIINLSDRAAEFTKISGTGTADSYGTVAHSTLNQSIVLSDNNQLNLYQFGATGDGIANDTGAWSAWVAWVGSKTITIGNYLVSAVVKRYTSPTYVNTVNSNFSAGYQALESNVNGENNTAFGKSSLQLTEGVLPLGSNNAAFGFEALGKNTEGYRSCAFGHQALREQAGNLVMGNSNSAFGYQCLFNNTTGKDNQAFGYLSMFFNVAGGGNVANGYRALYNNIGTDDGEPNFAAIDGSFNVAVGYESMLENTFGKSNTAIGWRAMQFNTTAFRNTAVGQEALRDNVTGNNNIAVGYHASFACVNGSDNVAVGYEALFTSTGGLKNVAIGRGAFRVSTSANNGVAVGYEALVACVGGINNVGVGYRALSRITSGQANAAIGYQALEFTTAGGSNLSFSNCSGLGNGSRVSAGDQVQLGNSSTTTYAYGAIQDRSDKRDKLDIKELTDVHIAFFMDVEWKQYRMNYRESYIETVELEDGSFEQVMRENDGSKAGNRYHIGAIAQQVEAAMKKHGVDFAGLQHHSIGGGEDIYSLGYQEFIGIQGLIIQKQQTRILSIEERLTNAGI